MNQSDGGARAMLEVILAGASRTTDGLGNMFQLLVGMAMQSCPGHEDHAWSTVALPTQGGLAAWQLRKAQALMLEGIGEPLAVADIAHQCGYSPSHFSRAFRKSVGVAPYQWLCSQRIERAKWLLINTNQALLDVAVACGFSERCHFTRMFARCVGMTPGAWRRVFGAGSEFWIGVSAPGETRYCA